MPGLGTIINTAAIVVGGLLGLLFKNLLTKSMEDTLLKASSVCVLFIGIGGAMQHMLKITDGALETSGSMMLIICFVLGSIVGELLDIEGAFERFGAWLRKKTHNESDTGFLSAFIHASLTVCIGAMAIVGSIQDGLLGDSSLLCAKAALDAYTDEEIPADKRVNVVAVMLEAYNDFSRFENLHFVRDVYGKYRELEAMGYAGTLMTDVFAGDTRVSEREFLTGLPYARIDKFVAPSNSYVWYFRENGYHTTGSHPCYAWFYNRKNINKNLGFAEYLFSENYFAERTWNDITYDAAYFPMLYELYESRDRSVPYFSYNITYQGHGPYEADNPYYTEPYVENGGWSEASQTILNNYLNAQAETTEMLYDFATQMLATGEPVVLVFFGDHKPWMGNGDSVYHELGINIDRSTDEGFRNYYSTRYLILANDAAKRVTGSDFRGEGETISASFLMNKVFELCGWRGSAYMQFTTAQMQKTPVVHRSFDLRSDDYRLYDDVTYYYRKNFVYES